MGNINIGQESPTNILNLFYALENGTAKTGEFILNNYLPNTETLLFSTGLEEIHGLMVADADWYDNSENNSERTLFYVFIPDANIGFGLNNIYSSNGYHTAFNGNNLVRSATRIDGGDVYCTAQFNQNAGYTPFAINHRIIWVAW